MLRAAVRLLEYPPIAPVLEHVVSGLSEKVPPAAAARGVSPDPGPAAAADSSPAVAAPPAAPEERQMLVSVVAELWACSRAGAVRGIRAGGVKVDGIEVTNPTALVLPSEVEL